MTRIIRYLWHNNACLAIFPNNRPHDRFSEKQLRGELVHKGLRHRLQLILCSLNIRALITSSSSLPLSSSCTFQSLYAETSEESSAIPTMIVRIFWDSPTKPSMLLTRCHREWKWGARIIPMIAGNGIEAVQVLCGELRNG